VEDRIREAQELEKNTIELAEDGFDMSAIMLEEVLSSEPPFETIVERDITFLPGVCAGYAQDGFYTRIITDLEHFPTFFCEEVLIYTKNVLDVRCLCIPQVPGLHGPCRLTELVINQAHKVVGHMADKRTEYVCCWFWW
ncbi:hypothetical protein B0H17DRAFT_856852, partial [Mycena rosella]